MMNCSASNGFGMLCGTQIVTQSHGVFQVFQGQDPSRQK